MGIAEERVGKEILFKGYGTEPFVYIARQSEDGKNSFGDAAYAVESCTELDRAKVTIPGASHVSKLDAPGSGEIMSFVDPVGHKVHLVYGQAEKEAKAPRFEKLVVNSEDENLRKGKFQCFEIGRARVHPLGHYGVMYPAGSYQLMCDWYTSKLMLTVSDILYKDGNPVTCFFYIDQGIEFIDYHAFFFKPAKSQDKLKVAHCA